MSLHKLSAGHGYDYLIRQVAALDATHRGRTDLASYYTERGETPGRWVGRGLAGVDGLDVGDVVTGEQMRLLFAEGRHPLADTPPAGGRVLAFGVPYRPSTGEQPFQAAVRARFADHNTALGLPRRAALPAEVRARLRGGLARNGSGGRRDATRRVTWSWRRRRPAGPARRRRRSGGTT
jgi:TrwC relaxase